MTYASEIDALRENIAKLVTENDTLRAQLSAQTCYVPPEFQKEMDELRAKLEALRMQEPVLFRRPRGCGGGEEFAGYFYTELSTPSDLVWEPLYAAAGAIPEDKP